MAIVARCTTGNAGLDAVVANGFSALGAECLNKESILKDLCRSKKNSILPLPPPKARARDHDDVEGVLMSCLVVQHF